MFDPIPRSVKRIWDAWNIRGLMMFSLFLQTILIMFAPLRKGTANKLIIGLIWSVYLLADWAANFAVGLIADSQRDASDRSVPVEHSDLTAFWPPFLLLHLGGPDTITAFALEDNELWIRHALGLAFQAVAAVYVFLLSLPQNKLAIPTILVFLAGIIKYFERTCALYRASLGKFQDSVLKEPDPGLNFAKLMDNIAWKQKASLPTKIIKIDEKPDNEESNPSQVEKKAGSDNSGSPHEEKEKSDEGEVKHYKELDEGEVVHYAYKFFNVFKGLIVDLIFGFHECDDSRTFFHDRDAEDALRVLEVELNFIYEALYSKMPVVHSLAGYCLRFISFALVMAAFSHFHFEVKKRGFNEFDVRITYALFFGAIALETVAFLMIMFSDWTFAVLYSPNDGSMLVKKIKSCVAASNRWFLILKRPRWSEFHHEKEKYKCKLLATRVLFRRWSGHVSGHNLIRYCLKGRPTNFHKVKIHEQSDAKQKSIRGFSGCKEIGFRFRFGDFFRFICGEVNHFLSFIYGEVSRPFGSIFNKVIDSLGLTEVMEEVRYLSHEPLTSALWEFVFKELRRKSISANDPEVAKKIPSERGDQILKDRSWLEPYLTKVPYDQSLLLWHIATELLYHTDEVTSKHREFSKLLSDYMLYLLVIQPTVMSVEAGIGKMRFQDTCAEAERLFVSKNLGSNEEKEACEEILDVEILFPPVEVKGDRSKSVLFDASKLAKVLNEMDDIENGEKKWELVSKIWVELLSYAACNSTARTHAQQLSKGGELITFVWLLMAHLGLGKQIQIISDQIKIRLIVDK